LLFFRIVFEQLFLDLLLNLLSVAGDLVHLVLLVAVGVDVLGLSDVQVTRNAVLTCGVIGIGVHLLHGQVRLVLALIRHLLVLLLLRRVRCLLLLSQLLLRLTLLIYGQPTAIVLLRKGSNWLDLSLSRVTHRLMNLHVGLLLIRLLLLSSRSCQSFQVGIVRSQIVIVVHHGLRILVRGLLLNLDGRLGELRSNLFKLVVFSLVQVRCLGLLLRALTLISLSLLQKLK
jgi:hypothetical protein